MGNSMIDYSIFLWKSPLKEDAVEMAYAKNQVRKVLTFDEFVKHISDHNGVFTRGTVKGVVSDTCACLVEQLLMGNKVQFGELGIFSISITCEPAATLKEFSEDNIKEVNILFNPGEDFENLRSKAEFNLVASRAVQAATIKAVKANETSVDLEAAKKKPNSTEDGDNKPSGDGGNTPSTGGSTPSDGGSILLVVAVVTVPAMKPMQNLRKAIMSFNSILVAPDNVSGATTSNKFLFSK